MFLIWIIFPYFILTLIKNKFWYYSIAYLPAIAFISAYGLMNIKKNFLRRTAISLVLLIGFVQFFALSYVNYKGGYIELAGIKLTPWPMKNILTGVKYYPQKGDWKQDAIIGQILKESYGTIPVIGIYWIDSNREARIGFGKTVIISRLESYTGASVDSLSYYLALKGIPHKIILLASDLKEKINNKINFIITPVELENINNYDRIKIENYKLIKEFIMPDASKVYLYKLNESSR